jgi:AraC-like DNA-binding protein/ligand-binding sensor protein
MITISFDELSRLSVFRRFYSLAYHLFGVSIALNKPGTREGILLGPSGSLNPFCRYLHTAAHGRKTCLDCDILHQDACRASRRWIRYQCHAGLTEFIIPIMVSGEIIAYLQCGQILDKRASSGQQADIAGLAASLNLDGDKLWNLYRGSKVVAPSVQEHLIELLELFANYLADAGTRLLLLEKGRTSQIVSLAETFIRENLSDRLPLESIAQAARTSRRNLVRLFKKETGSTIVERINTSRAERACELLLNRDLSVSAVALECGFGSIQQFNRVFKRSRGVSPRAWRKKNPGNQRNVSG